MYVQIKDPDFSKENSKSKHSAKCANERNSTTQICIE